MSLKHNRKRNVGLVYEQLVRRIGEGIVERDRTGADAALAILRKYFSAGAPLAEELSLYRTVMETRGCSRYVAQRVLGTLLKRARKLDRRTNDIKKSNLIREINYGFGMDFFSRHRVPEYRVLASLSVMVESELGRRPLSEEVERARIEEALVGFMCSESSDPVPVDHDRDELVYGLARKKFEDRYSRSLSEGQRRVLRSYIRSLFSGDQVHLNGVLDEDRVAIRGRLRAAELDADCKSDPVVVERLRVASTMLRERRELPPAEAVEEMLLFHSLVAELDSDG